MNIVARTHQSETATIADAAVVVAVIVIVADVAVVVHSNSSSNGIADVVVHSTTTQ